MPEMKVSWATPVIFAAICGGVPSATGGHADLDRRRTAWSSWAGGSGGSPASFQLPRQVAVDLGGHDGAQDGRAEAAADLHRGLLETAGDTGELHRGVADDDLGGADHDRGEAEAEQGEPERHHRACRCRSSSVDMPNMATAVSAMPPTSGIARAELGDQRAGERRADDHHAGERQQVQTGVDRAHAVHVLQVEGDEEQAAHEGEGHQHHQDHTGATAARERNMRQRDQRLPDLRLPEGEQRRSRTTDGAEERPASCRRPSPTSGALMSAQIRQNIAPDSRTMPRTSKERGRVLGAVVLEDQQAEDERRATPTGTLMKKTDCQLTCSTSTPPRIGPPAVEAPMTMPQMPMAMFSFSAGKVARSRPSAAGISRAPNRPCSTRKAIDQAPRCRRGRWRRRRRRSRRRRSGRSGGGRSGHRACPR